MAINEKELNEVSGGYGPWQQYAKGTYVRSASVSRYSRSASGTTSRTPTSSTSTRS